MALYSASEELLEIVCCFLDFHAMRELPKKIENPVMDFLVVGHIAQSESLKHFNLMKLEEWKNIPDPGADFRYRRTRKAAC